MAQYTTRFACDGCTKVIPDEDPRIQCELCRDYHLCANCFVVGRVSGSHAAYHPTQLFKSSIGGETGDGARTATAAATTREPSSGLPANATAQRYLGHGGMPALPPSRRAVAQFAYTAQAPTAIDLVAGEPVTDVEEREGDWWLGTNGQGATGYFPSSYVVLDADDASAKASWRPLLKTHGQEGPSPCFLHLLNEVFSHLDVDRSGSITPEELSAFFDAAAAPEGLLPCKSHVPQAGLLSKTGPAFR